ncbi:MAG: hypothetical protein JWN64_332 [Parcubacteria group bacterium]|nr:hypothetical protein [Parcubacteria group bacterium]
MALLLSAAGLASRWIDLAELNLLVVFSDALALNHGAGMLHVLRLGAAVVADLAKRTNKAQGLAAAGKTSKKRSRTLVLAATNLYACCVTHRAENSIDIGFLSRNDVKTLAVPGGGTRAFADDLVLA